MCTVPRLVEMELVVQGLLVQIRQNRHSPAQERLAIFTGEGGREFEAFPFRRIVVHGQHDLLYVVHAQAAIVGLAGGLVGVTLVIASRGTDLSVRRLRFLRHQPPGNERNQRRDSDETGSYEQLFAISRFETCHHENSPFEVFVRAENAGGRE